MAWKEKFKVKTKEKEKLSISQPLNFEHTAHVDVDDNRWRSPQTGPPPTINLPTPTPTTARADADQKWDLVVEIQKMATTIDQLKNDLREIVREEIAEEMASYKPHMVESSDSGVTERRDVPEKAASEDQEHSYQNVNWDMTKSVQLRRKDGKTQNVNKWLDVRRPLSECDKGLDQSLSSVWRKKPENKTAETLERRASFASPISNIVQTSADDRECLANALQSHAVMIINDVLFTETQLPDLLSEQGFLTDEECSTMRGLANRKDRIRTLLSVMKGRDMDTIKGFLTFLNRFNPEIVAKVYKTYSVNKANGMRCKLCAFCLMKTKVDITYVVDSIWEVFAIPDGLYNEIIFSQKPAGAQEVINFWERLADICNSHETNKRAKAFEALINGLMEKKYSHIANTFSSKLHTGNTFLKCHCKVVPLRQRMSFIRSTATSISARSSQYSSCEILTDVPLKGQENGDASLESIYETVQSREGDGQRADREPREVAPAYPPPVPLRTHKPRKTSHPPLPKKHPKPCTKKKAIATTNVEGEVKQVQCGTEETPTSMSGEGFVVKIEDQPPGNREISMPEGNNSIINDNRQPDTSSTVYM